MAGAEGRAAAPPALIDLVHEDAAGASKPVHGIIPKPRHVELRTDRSFLITSETVVSVPPGDGELLRIGSRLAAFLARGSRAEPFALREETAASPNSVRLQVGEVPLAGPEAYELTIEPEGATIAGRRPDGVRHGVQTLRHLLPPFLEYAAIRPSRERPVSVPAGRILDAPRFSWRGAMLDVARHFFDVRDVQRYAELMALHKLNRLHLHLTDDQGWRIEIRSWPRLAAHGGSTQVGGGPGGFFTQADYSRIVEHAADLGITVVPEIDLPGHVNAALASYPELNRGGVTPPLHTGINVGFSALDVGNPVTWKFVEDVLAEMAAITPGPYLHIGGDEVKALSPEQYSSFIEKLQRVVRSCGKLMIGWDEIMSAPLAAGTVVQHWRTEAELDQVLRKRASVIASIAGRTYLDMKYSPGTPIGLAWAGTVGVQDAYDWDPAAGGVAEGSLLGVEAPLWTETVATIRDAEYLGYPRLAAIAEASWTPQAERRWDDFRARLGRQAPRWRALGVNFYRAPEIDWAD